MVDSSDAVRVTTDVDLPGDFWRNLLLFVVGVNGLSFAFLPTNSDPAPMAMSGFSLSLLITPFVSYVDTKRAYASVEQNRWFVLGKRAAWVVGLSVPIINLGIAPVYAFRRRELVGRSSPDWWKLILAATLVSLVTFFQFESYSGSTTDQLIGLLFFASWLFTPLCLYYDARYTSQISGWPPRAWPWMLGSAVWAASWLTCLLYLYRRRVQMPDVGNVDERLDSLLADADQHIETAEHSASNEEYENAVESYSAAIAGLHNALSLAEQTHSDRVSRIEERLRTTQRDAEWTDVEHTRSQARAQVTEAKQRLESGVYESARSANREAQEAYEATLEAARALDDEAIVREIESEKEQQDEQFMEALVEQLLADADGHFEAGERNLENSQYEAAEQQYRKATSVLEDARAHADAVDSDLVEQIDRKTSTIRQQKTKAETAPKRDELSESASRGDERRSRAESRLSSGAYDDARESYESAADAYEEALRIANDIDDEDVAADLEAKLEAAEDGAEKAVRKRTTSHLTTASELIDEGDRYRADEKFDRALECYESALESYEAATEVEIAADVVDAAAATIPEVDEEAIEDRIAGTLADQRRSMYRTQVDRAEAAEARMEDAATDDRFGEAIGSCMEARDAYSDALDLTEQWDVGDPDAIEESVEDLDERREELELSRISARLQSASVDPSDPPETVAAEFEAILDDIESTAIDRERDLDLLRQEAQRRRIEAKKAALQASMESAADAFERGDYDDARDEFDRLHDAVAAIADTADEIGLDGLRADLEEMETACRANGDAARRAYLGIDDAPELAPIVPESDESELSGLDSEQPTTGNSEPADGDLPTDAGVGDALGAELPDHEVLVERYGSGGNADIHKIRLTESGETVALKVPRWQGTLSQSIIDEFRSEAETWERLDDHEHILDIRDWGLQPYPWMTLEFMEGGNLDDRADRLTWQDALPILRKTCEAVHYAHSRGIVHSDLKPENILFKRSGDDSAVRVADWGLARLLLKHSMAIDKLTPQYAAPEQIDPDSYGSIDIYTDIYQLGVIGYELLTGQPPVTADTHTGMISEVIKTEPTPPSDFDDSIPVAFDEVFETALAKDPADRYESVLYFRDALEEIAGLSQA